MLVFLKQRNRNTKHETQKGSSKFLKVLGNDQLFDIIITMTYSSETISQFRRTNLI